MKREYHLNYPNADQLPLGKKVMDLFDAAPKRNRFICQLVAALIVEKQLADSTAQDACKKLSDWFGEILYHNPSKREGEEHDDRTEPTNEHKEETKDNLPDTMKGLEAFMKGGRFSDLTGGNAI